MKPIEVTVPLGEIIALQMKVLDAKRCIAHGLDNAYVWADLTDIYEIVKQWKAANQL